MADADCFSGGSIAGAVIGTFLATIVLGAILLFLWNQHRKRRAQNAPLRDLVMIEDGDTNGGPRKDFSYDNPGFFDDSTDPKKSNRNQQLFDGVQINGTGNKKVANQDSSGKNNKQMPWGPLAFLFNRNPKNTLDDSALEEPQVYTATLKGHDFTGLGFNICGNMRDGIFIKDVMQRGPAVESKKILPGDKITSLTISFNNIVLDDALTLLSYASPYDVTLEMLRLPEKSLSHKGISLSSPSHSTGQGSSHSPTTDMVCHPFFKSHSIDDLRRAGKQLSHNDNRKFLKKENGIQKSQHSPMDSPSAVIVIPNQKRFNSSPAVKPQRNSSKKSTDQQQKESELKNKNDTDEIDTTLQQIHVKPEIIPRLKSKTTHVKSEAVQQPILVEAISPVLKMVYENEEMKPSAEKEITKPSRQNVKIECAQIPDPVVAHMTNISSKGESKVLTSPRPVTPAEITITIQEEISLPPIQKPERSQKKNLLLIAKEKKPKEKEEKTSESTVMEESQKQKEKPEKEKEPDKSKFSKFGIRVLPDISLNFGKRGSHSLSEDKEKDETSASSPKKEKIKSSKKEQKRDKENAKQDVEQSTEMIKEVSEFTVSTTMTTTEEKPSTPSTQEEKLARKQDERPPSADSKDSDSAEKSPKKSSSGFHMPNLGIKLFGHSKQYNLEPDKEGKGHNEHGTPNSKAEVSINVTPNVKVKKIDESSETHADDEDQSKELLESKESSEAINSKSPETPKEESKEKEKAGFMTKGLQSLRDLKEKVTHKLSSSHDISSTSSSSEAEGEKGDEEGETKREKRKKSKKEKEKEAREKSADAKLKEKEEKAKEKERLKAEKAAKKAELKKKHSKGTSSSESSSDESDHEPDNQNKKRSKNKVSKDMKDGEKKGSKKSKEKQSENKDIQDCDKIISADEMVSVSSLPQQTQSLSSKLVPAKPPVVPRKSKDSLKKEGEVEGGNEKVEEQSKEKKNITSSSSSSDEGDDENKVKSSKKHAPSPPMISEGTTGTLVVTKAEVIQAPKDVYARPEIVEATIKAKSKIPVKISVAGGNADSPDQSRSKIPDKRSASFGDLSSLQSFPKSKSNELLERAVSMDMGGEADGSSHIPNMVMSPVEDLSTAKDSITAVPHYKQSQASFSSSGSSSSETLKASPTTVHIVQNEEITSNEEINSKTIEIHKMMQGTVTMMNTIVHSLEESPSSPTPPTSADMSISSVIHVPPNEVTISTSGSSIIDEDEVEKIAQNAIDEIMAKVNAHKLQAAETMDRNLSEDMNSSIDSMSQARNVTIMNVTNEPLSKAIDIEIDEVSSDKTKEPKSDLGKLLRGDSKSRLMQTVADANDIKITQKQARKDSSTSSSSQSSPEIRSESKPMFPEATVNTNGANSPSPQPPPSYGGHTIEITSTELDGIMMSHSDFLAKQAILYPIESTDSPKQSSFDNWVYVDQIHSNTLPTPPEEGIMPSSSQGETRNGALSPTAIKMETKYETSELKVTTSSPSSKDSSAQTPTKVYSTTMTLPQRSITQITLGPESEESVANIIGQKL